MTLLEKLLGLFGRDTDGNSIKDYQAQSKATITTASVNPLYSALSPTSTGTFNVAVVGVYFHQEILQKICGNKREEGVPIYKQAMLVPENDNPEDANAVRVDIEGETVGHLSRRNATLWRSKMISENRSGVVMRPAEIVWDKGYVAEGSYGVLLDLDLSLPDSKIEPGSAGRVWESPSQPDHIEFLVDQLNRVELSRCKVGAPVNLWDATGTREIFIYRQGTDFGEGKIGICPDEVYRTIRKAPGCDASIASIYEGGCKIACRLISKAEMSERMRQVKEAEKARRTAQKAKLVETLRREFDKKYSPKAAIKAAFDINGPDKLTVGDKVYLDIKSKIHYLRYPNQLRVDLLNHAKERIGEVRTREPVLRIIKAAYNGYEFDLKVVSVYGESYAVVEIMPKKKAR
jgi:hypothetical protein